LRDGSGLIPERWGGLSWLDAQWDLPAGSLFQCPWQYR